MSISNAMAVVVVSDFDESRDWYANLSGRPADLRPMDGLDIWSFSDGGGFMLTLDPGKSGSIGATLMVDDLDQTRAELASREVEKSETFGTPGGAYVSTVTDPAGNQLGLSQKVDSSG